MDTMSCLKAEKNSNIGSANEKAPQIQVPIQQQLFLNLVSFQDAQWKPGFQDAQKNQVFRPNFSLVPLLLLGGAAIPINLNCCCLSRNVFGSATSATHASFGFPTDWLRLNRPWVKQASSCHAWLGCESLLKCLMAFWNLGQGHRLASTLVDLRDGAHL